jgi:hypothetical protein
MNHENDPPIPPALDAYARREQSRSIRVPPGFADKVQRRLAAGVARRRRLERIGGWALAASVLVAVAFLALPRNRPEPSSPRPAEVVSVKLAEEWNEAGRSLESLTTHAAEPAVVPARRFLAGSARMQFPEPNPPEPTLPPIEFASAAVAGLEPVANTPRRAVNTLLRDFGIDPSGN